jgi:hypothetical protein
MMIKRHGKYIGKHKANRGGLNQKFPYSAGKNWQSVLVDPALYGFWMQQPVRSRIPHFARCT